MGEEIIIDGVKLIGWPAEIVKKQEKLNKDFQELFVDVADIAKRMTAIEERMGGLGWGVRGN